MKRLLVVHHSRTGAAEQLAAAAAAAARGLDSTPEAMVETVRLRADQAHGTDLLAADGYLFVAPENLASMSGLMKEFFDRIYYATIDRLNGRPYALIIAAGTDGSNAARQIQRIATGLRLREVAPPLIVRNGAQTPEQILAPKTVGAADLRNAAELGAALAAGLAVGIF